MNVSTAGEGAARAAKDPATLRRSVMHTYQLVGAGGYTGLLEQPSPHLKAGDVIVLADGREALVTVRMESWHGSRFAATLHLLISPKSDAH